MQKLVSGTTHERFNAFCLLTQSIVGAFPPNSDVPADYTTDIKLAMDAYYFALDEIGPYVVLKTDAPSRRKTWDEKPSESAETVEELLGYLLNRKVTFNKYRHYSDIANIKSVLEDDRTKAPRFFELMYRIFACDTRLSTTNYRYSYKKGRDANNDPGPLLANMTKFSRMLMDNLEEKWWEKDYNDLEYINEGISLERDIRMAANARLLLDCMDSFLAEKNGLTKEAVCSAREGIANALTLGIEFCKFLSTRETALSQACKEIIKVLRAIENIVKKVEKMKPSESPKLSFLEDISTKKGEQIMATLFSEAKWSKGTPWLPIKEYLDTSGGGPFAQLTSCLNCCQGAFRDPNMSLDLEAAYLSTYIMTKQANPDVDVDRNTVIAGCRTLLRSMNHNIDAPGLSWCLVALDDGATMSRPGYL